MSWDTLKYVDSVDIATDEAMIEELYFSQVQRHDWYQINKAIAKNIYGEPDTQAAIDGAYTLVDPAIPIHVKLDPEKELLSRFGYDRPRDALLWFCNKIVRDRSLAPPTPGDIVVFTFTDVAGNTVKEWLELRTASPWDFSRQTKAPYQTTCDAIRIPKRDFS